MNDTDLSSKNASNRRTYHRRNRKKNRTDDTIFPVTYLPLTTSIITTNATALVNSSSVLANDFFAPISFLTQNKYFFLIGLSLLIFLCVISIVFLIVISNCIKGGRRKNGRLPHIDKRYKNAPDFLDGHDGKGDNEILLKEIGPTSSINHSTMNTNGNIPNDNISNTFSIDPLIEQKILNNNPPNAMSLSLSPAADDTSLDTLRGSLISSPSQNMSTHQRSSTPTRLTETESAPHTDDRTHEGEKDDDLHDLDLKRIQPRYTKATTNSGTNLLAHRTSGSSIEQSIRKLERRAEEVERSQLHGSNSNLYEKELRRRADEQRNARKEHTVSQASLVSRTSEDSCY